jgi:heme exporter protein D
MDTLEITAFLGVHPSSGRRRILLRVLRGSLRQAELRQAE